jgi:hypothetical protein
MKYVVSYAYDAPNYADFLVRAKNKKEALKKTKAAFRSGRFRGVQCEADDTMYNERVFILRTADEYDDTLERL